MQFSSAVLSNGKLPLFTKQNYKPTAPFGNTSGEPGVQQEGQKLKPKPKRNPVLSKLLRKYHNCYISERRKKNENDLSGVPPPQPTIITINYLLQEI